MKSFSEMTKAELCKNENTDICCNKAEYLGMLLFGATITKSNIKFVTENHDVLDNYKSLSKFIGIDELVYSQIGKSSRMSLSCSNTENSIKLLNEIGITETDLENTKYMMHLPNRNIDETRIFLEGVTAEWQKETPTFYEFAIILDGMHIGAVSVYLNEDSSEGELGWIIDKDYWGCGYTSEAGKALIDMCIEKLDIHKFVAHCDSENEASKGVMRKLGMQLKAEYDGRKNRASDEIRRECEYRMEVV